MRHPNVHKYKVLFSSFEFYLPLCSILTHVFCFSLLHPFAGNNISQNMRIDDGDARMPIAARLVAVSAAEHTHWQVTLSGNLPLSGQFHIG